MKILIARQTIETDFNITKIPLGTPVIIVTEGDTFKAITLTAKAVSKSYTLLSLYTYFRSPEGTEFDAIKALRDVWATKMEYGTFGFDVPPGTSKDIAPISRSDEEFEKNLLYALASNAGITRRDFLGSDKNIENANARRILEHLDALLFAYRRRPNEKRN